MERRYCTEDNENEGIYTCIFGTCAWKLALETFFPERSHLLNIKALNPSKKEANPPTNEFIKILKI